MRVLHQCITANPKAATPYMSLATLYLGRGDRAGMDSVFQEFRIANNSSTDALLSVSGFYLKIGDNAQAKNVTIHAARAEKIAPFKADIVVARAVAPLNQLLYIAESFLTSHSQCLFLKGKAAEGELTEARMNWRMNAETLPSRADPVGIILRLGAVSRETSAAAS